MKELIEKYNQRKYIFILGSGRNGTTFLAKELAKVNNIATTPEDKFFFWSMSYRKKYNLNKTNDFLSFLDLSFKFIFDFRKQDFYNSEENILSRLSDIKKIISKEFDVISKLSENKKYKLTLDIILDIFSNKDGADYFILHTPATLLVFDIVKSILEPYKLILMQRDIHTFFASSMKGKNRWFASNLDCIIYWNIIADKLKDIQQNTQNNTLIYQEMMLEKPDIVKEKLEQFLSISLNNISLSSNGENSYFKDKFDRKSLLTNNEIFLIESFSKDNINYFKYNFLDDINKKIDIKYKFIGYLRKTKLLFNYMLREYGYFYIIQNIKNIINGRKK